MTNDRDNQSFGQRGEDLDKVKKTFIAMGVAFVVSSIVTLLFKEYGLETRSLFNLMIIVLISVFIIMGLEKLSTPNSETNDEHINKERQ